jgi:hypothetical protein
MAVRRSLGAFALPAAAMQIDLIVGVNARSGKPFTNAPRRLVRCPSRSLRRG